MTCCHEESSVGMAHGYAKIEGKPLCIFAHGTVGLQHAAMAIYNAYCDRVPVYIVIGNNLDATKRDSAYGEWPHSVQDAAAMVRDYVKWDDVPISLQHFAESAVRAYKIAMTPPMAPVLLVADSELQENPIPEQANLHIPKLTLPGLPQGDSGSVMEAARLLVQAENPAIMVDHYARTQDGLERLIEFAETLQAPVIDLAGRLNFPTRHPLNQSSRRARLIGDADVIIGLEVTNFWGSLNTMRDQVHRTSRPIMKTGAKLISITTGDLNIKANYQDFLSGLLPIHRGRFGHGRGRRGNPAVADRGDQAPDHCQSQAGVAGSRSQASQSTRTDPGPSANRRDLCVGREPDQYRPCVRRDLEPDQG
ncbi:MAG: thiamine pyrophosphate-binding protein [Candidatus Acidiferrales bacterium]